jgi:hypothetical protein
LGRLNQSREKIEFESFQRVANELIREAYWHFKDQNEEKAIQIAELYEKSPLEEQEQYQS